MSNPGDTMQPTCRIKPEGNFDAFHLNLIDEGDAWEIVDPTGKLPLDAFDLINSELAYEEDSGRVRSEDTDQWYAWEIIEPEGDCPYNCTVAGCTGECQNDLDTEN